MILNLKFISLFLYAYCKIIQSKVCKLVKDKKLGCDFSFQIASMTLFL